MTESHNANFLEREFSYIEEITKNIELFEVEDKPGLIAKRTNPPNNESSPSSGGQLPLMDKFQEI